MWKKKRGQALVEFVIILPIFLFMLLGIIDIAKILFYQNRLESYMDQVIEEYHQEKSYEEINTSLQFDKNDFDLEVSNENNQWVSFSLSKEVDILTPGLNLIFASPYRVEAKRTIAYE